MGAKMPRNTKAFMVELKDDSFFHNCETGEIYKNMRDLPDGAIYYADWYKDRLGPDGRHLIAKCPGGHIWHIDGRASNCTMREDHEHRCWVRHGTPPNLTVDKSGNTCAAGAGSIQAGNWHGFLRNGIFEEC